MKFFTTSYQTIMGLKQLTEPKHGTLKIIIQIFESPKKTHIFMASTQVNENTNIISDVLLGALS